MLIKDQIFSKLKKYFFYISVVLFVLTFSHLVYAYLYTDATSIPVKGGTVSEAVVGDVPHLNPLIPSTDYNKYVVSLLYRSLLRYDIEEKKLVSDIASCDLKLLSQIECFLQNDVNWSDGSEITTQDIVATLDMIRISGSNPLIASLLADTKIEQGDRSIILKNPKADISFLNVLLQPIVSQKVLNELMTNQITGKFPTQGVYSGPYKVEGISQDENIGVKKLVLEKNEQYKASEVFLDKISFKVFEDINQFLKHKDSVNLFNDKANIISDSIPRLEAHTYILPQFVGLYINVENIPELALRTFILNSIDRDKIIKILSENNYQAVLNPFMSEINVDALSEEKNVVNLIQSKGYYKKSELIKDVMKQEQKVMSSEASIAPKVEVKIEPSKFIISPQVNNINFVSEDDILLKGEVKEQGVTGVYINDYKLQGYTPGDDVFYYRLKKADYETIEEGKNTYQIFFETEGTKTLKEEIVFVYYTDTQKLEDERQKLLSSDTSTSPIPALEVNSSQPSSVSLQKFDALSDTLYYNKDLQSFAYSLYYLDTDIAIQDVAKNIKDALGQFGIDVVLAPISVSDLNEMLKKGEKKYDMILAGIHLGYFDYNLFPYFHSSQIKNGYNFSNFKKLSLDILLEEMKSGYYTQEKITEYESKVLDIFKQEQVFKTIYTPVLRNLVDKNIKNYSMAGFLPDETLRFEGLKSAYIDEKKILDISGKTFGGFFGFLKKIITQ